MRTTNASKKTAMARPKPIILTIGSEEPMKPAKTLIMMTAAAADHPGAVPEAGDDGLPGPLPVDVRLAHPGDEEDLVVHGQAEDHTHHEDRHHAHDRPGLLDAEQRASQPHWKTATTAPSAATTESRKPSAALSGTRTERKTTISSRNARPTTSAR